MNAKEYFFPESAAGGYFPVDGTVDFYCRVNGLVQTSDVVLNFGAGRGKGAAEDPVPYRRALQTLRGKCAKVIGVDIDTAILANDDVNEAYVIAPGERLPIASESVDVIVSDWVFEHISTPSAVCSEFDRVLKPGGSVCARTPNRWGYIGISARIVPNRFHVSCLKVLQPSKNERDTFPTAYKLNTRRAMRANFPEGQW